MIWMTRQGVRQSKVEGRKSKGKSAGARISVEAKMGRSNCGLRMSDWKMSVFTFGSGLILDVLTILFLTAVVATL